MAVTPSSYIVHGLPASCSPRSIKSVGNFIKNPSTILWTSQPWNMNWRLRAGFSLGTRWGHDRANKPWWYVWLAAADFYAFGTRTQITSQNSIWLQVPGGGPRGDGAARDGAAGAQTLAPGNSLGATVKCVKYDSGKVGGSWPAILEHQSSESVVVITSHVDNLRVEKETALEVAFGYPSILNQRLFLFYINPRMGAL